MTKKETLKWTLQILASIISAVLTALGATSCMGFSKKEGHPNWVRLYFFATRGLALPVLITHRSIDVSVHVLSL